MPVVVAVLTPLDGHTQNVLDAFEVAAPLVHAERGCELYAVHTDGTRVVVVERWTELADLQAHSAGAAIAELNRLNAGHLDGQPEVLVTENVPFGDPRKGTIA
ncbi:putative quinol monooxygenase [Leifsonia poae]|uniref:Antibiotic biosynthesis monooxygenase n=1 Tax=Leifsonia poae TaxID=110933 RepID=A0A9W6HCW9_9MICO|nr:antibiotic biosynthesis monooxygenase [Leifsonia poae]GLJ78169.1 antibiotic biosynthesis monooxygenase [Leifsonia poae]